MAALNLVYSGLGVVCLLKEMFNKYLGLEKRKVIKKKKDLMFDTGDEVAFFCACVLASVCSNRK